MEWLRQGDASVQNTEAYMSRPCLVSRRGSSSLAIAGVIFLRPGIEHTDTTVRYYEQDKVLAQVLVYMYTGNKTCMKS